jgi:nucleotide-binding universal stress UspA family protein
MYKRILVALDGSAWSEAGGEIALDLAARLKAKVAAAHVYDAGLHGSRFREMEPVLPPQFQEGQARARLRKAHQRLIQEGFEALSQGYVERFLETARRRGVAVEQVLREGRNYLKLLEIADNQRADLVILGTLGIGKVGDDALGSTASRVLRLARCDVLLSRPGSFEPKVAVGVDGSRDALEALKRAVSVSRALARKIGVVTVFDPQFHLQVFKTMAESLTPEKREAVGLSKQESLHQDIIDDGLRGLYETFLEEASLLCRKLGTEVSVELLRGKPARALAEYAAAQRVSLVVVGRFGHHREEAALLGANSEALAARAPCSVLVCCFPAGFAQGSDRAAASLLWTEAALAKLNRVPFFVRPMVRKQAEKQARSLGRTRVELDDLRGAAERMSRDKAQGRKKERGNDEPFN